MPMLFQMLLPFAVEILKNYVASSETNQDDKILEIVQDGAKYLASSDNNDLSLGSIAPIVNSQMREGL